MLVQSPNFFGVIEDIPAIAEIAHAKGALLIVSIAEAVSLGIVRPPVEADIVSMEAQSFGVALSYGGPFCGVIAAKEQVPAPDARPPCRPDRRQRRESRICADALDARAAYPPREGDFEHLHQSGTGRADGDDLSDRLWQGRHPRAGRAQPGQGRITPPRRSARSRARSCCSMARRASTNLFCRPRVAGAMEPAAAGRKDRRRRRPEPLVSGAGQCNALVRDRNGDARADRRSGESAGGRAGGGDRRWRSRERSSNSGPHTLGKVRPHQTQNEALVFEKSSPGKRAYKLPPLDVPAVDAAALLGDAHRKAPGCSPS